MSIASELYAEEANYVKNQWTARLREALDNRDWDQMAEVVRQMEEYEFTE